MNQYPVSRPVAPPPSHRPPVRHDEPIPNVIPADVLDVLPAEPPRSRPLLEAIVVEEQKLPPLRGVAPPAHLALPAPAQDMDIVPVSEEAIPVLELVARPSILVRIGRGIASMCSWIFGVLALILGLAILAGIPIVQFLTLGYLLEVGGRVARTGRLRDGFVGVRKAARVGSLVIGTVLMLVPLYFVSAMATSAELVDPGGVQARAWEIGLTSLTVVLLLHIIGAWSRGGRLHHFLWPAGNPITLLRRMARGEAIDALGLLCMGNFWWLGRRLWQGGYYAEARDAVWDFVVSLRLPYYFWLGLRGFVGALIWIALPVSLLALGRLGVIIDFHGEVPQGLFLFLLVMIGWFWSSLVLLYVPFMMLHFARENRFSAIFEIGAVRHDYQRAPILFFISLLLTLAMALPLYLLRIEQVFQGIAWLLTLPFILTIFPTKLLMGWAMGRGRNREKPRVWLFRWLCRPLMLLTAAAYVFFLFFTQYISGEGALSLYGQHAFMLPVPFFGFDR
jgi:hypothetical protein